MTTAAAVLTTCVLAATPASAQAPGPDPAAKAEPPFRFSGLMFGDYYYFAQDHDPRWEGQQGFWFRRIYFTFDYTFTPKVATRFRLEANSDGKLLGGSMTPYVKDAYLRWTFAGRQQVTFGLQPSLTLDFADSFWGLRHIEKPPVDLYRWDSTRETGLALSGSLNAANTIKYAVQVGNDSGINAETNTFKALRVAARYETNPGLAIEGAYGYYARDRDADRTLWQVLAGYRSTWGRAGFQYAHQQRRAVEGSTAPDLELDLYSAYAVADVRPQKLSVFARLDRFADPCPDCAQIDYVPIDTTAKFTLLVAGLEYYIIPAVRFSPNVEWVAYGAPADPSVPSPKDDVVWRATFYWVW